MLWTEKYRPQSLEEILGQDKFVSDARNWKEGMPNLLLYGEAGIGKTAAAGVIANFVLGEDKESNFFEINASDDRRLEVVRTTIKEISSAMKIGDVPHKVILLDEMDGMTPDAQNALKRLMERYSSNVRFIITCNHRHKMSAEGISDVDFTQLEEFIGTLNGDLRRGITELQASVSSDTSLTMQIERMQQPYNELLEHILNDQYELALNKMHDMIHMSLDMKTICIGIHDVILKKSSLPTAKKFKYLRVVGESEWRSGSMTPKVLAAWMVGQLI